MFANIYLWAHWALSVLLNSFIDISTCCFIFFMEKRFIDKTSLAPLQLDEGVIVLFHNTVKTNSLFYLLFKERRDIRLLAETRERKFQSSRNFWTVLASNEERQKCSWSWWSALANDIYYLNTLVNGWCKGQGSFLGLLKHYTISLPEWTPEHVRIWIATRGNIASEKILNTLCLIYSLCPSDWTNFTGL